MGLMIIGEAETPMGRLVLEEWVDRMNLYLDENLLMTSAEAISEIELARLAVEAARENTSGPLDVLVLGFGLGKTIGALLELDGVRHVVAIELFEVLLRWLGDHPEMEDLFRDPRLIPLVADAAALPLALRPGFDAILVDVGNGPLDPVLETNRSVYATGGLRELKARLRPGGVLGVWSAHHSEPFERELERTFGELRYVEIPLKTGREGLDPDLVYLAVRAD